LSANLSVNTPTIPTPTAVESKKKEPTIIPIVMPLDKLEKLKKCLASRVSSGTKNNLQSKTCGKCRVCGGIPEFKLIYQFDGATKVEKYCSKCLSGRDKIIEIEKGLESQITIVVACSEYIESLEQEVNNNHVYKSVKFTLKK
jgi:hypothetical protein